MRPGQFVMLLASCNSDMLLDRDGSVANGETSVPVFDTLPEAVEFATRSIAPSPSVCACIYDHYGRSGDPVRRIYHESVRHRFDEQIRARRHVWAGPAFSAHLAIWAVIAWRDNERFLWFYIFGIKLFTVGTVLCVRGSAFSSDNVVDLLIDGLPCIVIHP